MAAHNVILFRVMSEWEQMHFRPPAHGFSKCWLWCWGPRWCPLTRPVCCPAADWGTASTSSRPVPSPWSLVCLSAAGSGDTTPQSPPPVSCIHRPAPPWYSRRSPCHPSFTGSRTAGHHVWCSVSQPDKRGVEPAEKGVQLVSSLPGLVTACDGLQAACGASSPASLSVWRSSLWVFLISSLSSFTEALFFQFRTTPPISSLIMHISLSRVVQVWRSLLIKQQCAAWLQPSQAFYVWLQIVGRGAAHRWVMKHNLISRKCSWLQVKVV